MNIINNLEKFNNSIRKNVIESEGDYKKEPLRKEHCCEKRLVSIYPSKEVQNDIQQCLFKKNKMLILRKR